VELLEPVSIGTHAVAPSRVMFGPHETNLGDGRRLSARHAAYYARRAAGGAGIIVIEEAAVHPSDWAYERSPLATECEQGWVSIMTAVRSTGTLPVVLAGLGHSGGQGISHWSQRELWAPSAVPEVVTREVPKVMEQRDIDEVVAGFASATRLAIASGVDGVEINAGQFSLVRQFLSGLTNMRTDDYGTDRLRFAREVLTAVRAAASASGAVVALRLSVDELAPWAGIVPEAGASLAAELAPFVDLITVVRGSIYSAALTRPDGHVEPGFAIDLARRVRAALRAAGSAMPVVAQGSIVDWGQAEWAITDGAADAVEMTRAQLADASLVSKLRANQSARIRPCILCNQTCKVRDNRNPIVTCVVDPRTGHELDDPAEPASSPASSPASPTASPNASLATAHARRLTVVGGGVAGLEAARVGALAGYTVELHERIARVGGVLRFAAAGHGRSRLGLFADWLEAECRILGVDIRTESALSNHDVANLVGGVIIATGSIPSVLPFSIDGGRVIDATEVLDDPQGFVATTGDGVIVVWDPIGGPIAISVAELLAPLALGQGGSVTLVTPDLLVGEKLSLSGDLAPSQGRLHGSGVALVKRAIVRRVISDGTVIEDRFSGKQSTIAARVMVVCAHRVPDTEIDREERRVQIGDRVAPRSVLEAVLEARRAVGRIAR
jgi:mycofactocin system FadH/OYE family oxidoreductase 1